MEVTQLRRYWMIGVSQPCDVPYSINTDGACRFAKLDRFVMGKSKDITGKEAAFYGVL